jgi:UDP-glucose 4-epimerase
MIRSIVTGGSGFIGSHVVDVLCKAGHHVVILDRTPPRTRTDVEYVDVDILDPQAVCRAVAGADYVHHMAAVSNVNEAYDAPLECVDTNVQGTANVLEAARREGVKRVFFSSSVWVYNGTPSTWVDENTPLHMPGPGHVYTSSKIAGELLAHDYAALYKLPVTVFRYGVVYGPRMRDELLIPTLLRRAFGGQSLQVAGGGQQARNFVYVEDLARAHLLALADACSNQTFNLDGSRPVTVLEVAERVCKLIGSHVTIEHTPGRPGDYSGKLVSQEKSAHIMGWRASTSFDEGMRRTYDWYRATHPGSPPAQPEARGVQPEAN